MKGVPIQTDGPPLSSRGVILPFLLFLLLALTLLAHGTLLLARRELDASWAFLHATRSREVARGALWAALDFIPLEIGDPPLPGLPREILRETLDDGSWRRASLRWLGPELFFLEGRGGSRGWAGFRRMGAVGWRLDPMARMEALQGWLETGGGLELQGGGELSLSQLLSTPLGWEAEACATDEAALRRIFRENPVPAVFGLSSQGGQDSTAVIPGLGFLEGAALLGSSQEPGPGESPGPGGWTEPGSGCPGRGDPVFLGSRGSMELIDRWSCGLLIVEGDLVMKGGGVFQGVLLVGGELRMEGEWVLQGMARVKGSVRIQEGASFEASACAAARTLRKLERLREPLLLPGALQITPF